MGNYEGPATVEWTEGGSERELAVECRAESRIAEPYGTEEWDGDLVDTLGVLGRLADADLDIHLRTPFGIGGIAISTTGTRAHSEFGASRPASHFKGSGPAPF